MSTHVATFIRHSLGSLFFLKDASRPPPDLPPSLHAHTLTPDFLLNLTSGRDFIGPLSAFNGPASVVFLLFEFVSPLSLALNLFVLVSCAAILVRGSSDRPALVLIAYNALLDIFTIVADALVATSAVNPSLAETAAPLPDGRELQRRCSVEHGEWCYWCFL